MITVRKFESNRHRLNPICPCGKSNKDGKFSPQKGYAGMNVGHCHSCGKDFWDEEGSIIDVVDFKEEVPVFCTPDMQELIDHFDESMKSDFAQFLIRVFGEDNTIEAIRSYYLGVFEGDVIFWQMDRDKYLRAGKVMRYDRDGKRKGVPRWWHKIKDDNCQLNQYFFGGHLIDDSDKPIAVVEGEKTAVIMSIVNPSFIWIATGGVGGLQDNKCNTISEFEVVLFPDAGCFDKWKETADKFSFEISRECEIWMANGQIRDGDDIADYFLKIPYGKK